MKTTWRKIMAGALLGAMVMTQMLPGSVLAADKDADKNAEQLSHIVENTIKTSQEAVDKEETVYVKADATGAENSITVSDWLKNPDGKAELTDQSDLKDIENVKGDETYTENGKDITWKANGNDIYYQGTTDEKVPVKVHVSYKLDGKSIEPSELAGKSGKVTIRFDYTNEAKKTVTVNGRKKEATVPFVMITGLLLPTDTFRNVEVTNGKLISEGNNQIVLGYALPGLKDSLGITDAMLNKEKEISIPDYVEVTADTEKFEMGMTLTLAANDLLSEVDLDGKLDADDIAGSISQLSSASNQLADGSGQLHNGITEMNGGLGTYCQGVSMLNDGLTAAQNGAAQLVAGYEGSEAQVGAVNAAQSLASGAAQLSDGTTALANGAAALSTGAQQLQGGVKALTAGVTGMYASVASNMENYAGYQGDIAAATGAYQQAMAAYQSTAAQVAAGAADASALESAAAGVNSALQALCSAYSEAGAYQALATVKSGMDSQNLSASIPVLEQGADDVAAGAQRLASGLGESADGAGRLASGSSQLKYGIGQLYAGTQQLSEGVSQAAAGSEKLVSNNSKLLSGMTQLEEGSATLADGMLQFNQQGIQKLVDIFGGDLKDLLDNVEATKAASDAYDSFSGAKDGARANVKFIIETEGISVQ